MSEDDLIITITLRLDEENQSLNSTVDYGNIEEFASRLPRDPDFPKKDDDRIYKLTSIATHAVASLISEFCDEARFPLAKFIDFVLEQIQNQTKLSHESDDFVQ
jgi:hypothetical protein